MAINYLYFYTAIAVDCKDRSEKSDKQNIKRITLFGHDVSGPNYSWDEKKSQNVRDRV